MTEQEFSAIASRLEHGWAGAFPPQTVAEYWDALKGHTFAETMASLDKLRTTHEFRPTIAAMCKARNNARNLSPQSLLPGLSAPALTEGVVSPERAQEMAAELVRRLNADAKKVQPAQDGGQMERLRKMRESDPVRYAAAMEANRTTELSFREAWDAGGALADELEGLGLS